MGVYFADTGISQFKSFGSSSKHAESGPESFGIGWCRFVGTAPGILGLVSSGLGADLGSKSTIPGRIHSSFCLADYSTVLRLRLRILKSALGPLLSRVQHEQGLMFPAYHELDFRGSWPLA